MGAYKQVVLAFLEEADTTESSIVAYITKDEFAIIIPSEDSKDILSARFIQIDKSFLLDYPTLLRKAEQIFQK